MKRLIRETSIYAVGAAAAFVADFSTLWFLVDRAGMHYLVAATISFLVGTIVVYWVSVRHAFQFRRIAGQGTEFGYFATIGVVGIGLNLLLMYVLVEWLTLHYLVAKVGAATVSFFVNFGMRRWFLFTEPTATESRSRAEPEHR